MTARLFGNAAAAMALAAAVGCAPAADHVAVARYSGNRTAAISYTFDDGLQEHYTVLFPELRRRGLKATFCIVGSNVGKSHKGVPCMTWEQLREMAADGQEIASHGLTHTSVGRLSGESLRHEVQGNDTLIADSAGVFPRTYVFPGNRTTDEALRFCLRGRVAVRTGQESLGSKRDSLWLRRWTDRLLRQGGWGVGMTHGISVGYDSIGSPQRFWHHLDHVCSLSDSIWVAPYADVAAYVAERDATALKVKRAGGKTVVVPVCRLDSRLFNVPLTLVVESSGRLQAVQGGHRLLTEWDGRRTVFDFDPHGGKIIIW